MLWEGDGGSVSRCCFVLVLHVTPLRTVSLVSFVSVGNEVQVSSLMIQRHKEEFAVSHFSLCALFRYDQ